MSLEFQRNLKPTVLKHTTSILLIFIGLTPLISFCQSDTVVYRYQIVHDSKGTIEDKDMIHTSKASYYLLLANDQFEWIACSSENQDCESMGSFSYKRTEEQIELIFQDENQKIIHHSQLPLRLGDTTFYWSEFKDFRDRKINKDKVVFSSSFQTTFLDQLRPVYEFTTFNNYPARSSRAIPMLGKMVFLKNPLLPISISRQFFDSKTMKESGSQWTLEFDGVVEIEELRKVLASGKRSP